MLGETGEGGWERGCRGTLSVWAEGGGERMLLREAVVRWGGSTHGSGHRCKGECDPQETGTQMSDGHAARWSLQHLTGGSSERFSEEDICI